MVSEHTRQDGINHFYFRGISKLAYTLLCLDDHAEFKEGKKFVYVGL